jgi:hypothetical protein
MDQAVRAGGSDCETWDIAAPRNVDPTCDRYGSNSVIAVMSAA